MLRAAGRQIAKRHKKAQRPHGRQSVKKLMAHGASASSIELSGDTKLFDRVARKWNVEAGGYTWLVHSTDMVPVGEEVGIWIDPFDIQIMNKPESVHEEAVSVEE